MGAVLPCFLSTVLDSILPPPHLDAIALVKYATVRFCDTGGIVRLEETEDGYHNTVGDKVQLAYTRGHPETVIIIAKLPAKKA